MRITRHGLLTHEKSSGLLMFMFVYFSFLFFHFIILKEIFKELKCNYENT